VTPVNRPKGSFFDTYTRDLTADDLQRLFTRDAREAWRFFTRHLDLTGASRWSPSTDRPEGRP
jgi:hypothetical protein